MPTINLKNYETVSSSNLITVRDITVDMQEDIKKLYEKLDDTNKQMMSLNNRVNRQSLIIARNKWKSQTPNLMGKTHK